MEMFRLLPILIVLAAGQLGDARKFVISNQCKAPVWAAYTAVSGANGITVNGKAGTGMWLQPAGQKDELDVPEEFSAGKFWAATGCNAQGTGCKIGGCPNGKCDGTQIGQSGATLAEFTLPGMETFDISITDGTSLGSSHPCSTTNIPGFNVPIAITPTGGTGAKCTKVTCGATTDLLTKCDPALAFPFGSDTVWSCFNPCTAGVQYETGAEVPFNFKTAKSCCPDNSKATCKTDTDVPFYDTMKAACNDGFVYPPETEMNHECKGPEYLIEFCPGGKGIGANPSGNAPVNQCAGPGGPIVGGRATGTNSDGGGSFAGLPAGAGAACDGSTASSGAAGTSEQNSAETALTGAIPGAGTVAGTGAAAGAGTAVGTGAVAGGGSSTKAAATQAAATANSGAGTGAVESPAPVDPPAPAVSSAAAVSSPAVVAPAAIASSVVAPAPAAPAATSAPCRGRRCRSGNRSRGNEARRLAKAVEERDGEWAARV